MKISDKLNMKKLRIVFMLLVAILFTACFGDKKAVIGADLSNTAFVNKSFKGNTIAFDEVTDVCNLIKVEKLAGLYDVPTSNIVIVGQGDVVQQQNVKTCMVRVKLDETDWNFLTGTISIFKDDNTNENWEESWSMKKAMSKSGKWIPNMGKAALFTSAKRKLAIKFDGYVLEIIAPGAPFNKEEQARNRDFEKITLQIVKDLGFIN